MSINRHVGALAVLGFFLLGFDAYAQPPAEEKLAGVKTLKCEFPLFVLGHWTKDGEPQAEVTPTTMSIRFEAIDTEEGTARAIGKFGPSDIIVKLSSGTLHFMQVFREGPLYTTTVFAKESRGGKLKAVHTRHEFTDVSLPGFTSRPEQYYGECEVER